MKAELSEFLKDKRGEMREFLGELLKKFKYVSLLATDVKGTQYVKTTRDAIAKDNMVSERGFVVRIYEDEFFMEYSFSEWEPKERIREIKNLAKEKKELKGLNFVKYSIPEEEPLKADFQSEFEIAPDGISESEIFKRLTAIVDDLKTGENVAEVQSTISAVSVSKVFISKERDLSQSYVFTTGMSSVFVARDNQYKYDYKTFSGRCGMELLSKMEKEVGDLPALANELLNAENIKPGEYDIICNPDVTGLICHEAFGHGVEMDMFVKHRAIGAEYLGKRVASEITRMRDGANSIEEVSSYFFDDEGTLAGDTLIIEDGILRTGMCDALSAQRLGVKPTGNGKRESYERKAYTRMTNTFFEEGNETKEDMIKSISYGYLLEGMMSGMEDPKNWGIQCQLMKGREIKDGKLTGKVVSPVVLTGYVPDLLNSISMVSKGVEMSGSGFCGKGYKEYVKTSTGGSYIKARGRLG